MPNSSRVSLRSVPFIASVATAFLLCCSSFVFTEANNVSIVIDLIHRDSPKSPFYNPTQTSYDRLKNAFLRSLYRASYIASDLVPGGGEHLMEISYGMPPFKTLVTADTGSDFTWIQCLPCIQCFKQKYPIFDPQRSPTFKIVPYRSRTCQTFPQTSLGRYGACLYRENYGDGSSTRGVLARETITFGSYGTRAGFSGFIFGCGHENGGRFPYESSGIVGLGTGKQSLVSQLRNVIHGKFSYCLGPLFKQAPISGTLILGNNSLVSGPGVVSTPLVLGTFYYLILEGMSVGNTRLEYYRNPSNPSSAGNIIIDSGSTVTRLPSYLYRQFESAMKNSIVSNGTIKDPSGIFGLCYYPNGIRIPSVTVHFRGADLILPPKNTFVKTSPHSICLAFRPTYELPILGSLQHSDFWVEYDLQNRMVSFKPTYCTKQ